jgi:hypothetical protein
MPNELCHQRTEKRLGVKSLRAYLNKAKAREKLPGLIQSAAKPLCVSRLFEFL